MHPCWSSPLVVAAFLFASPTCAAQPSATTWNVGRPIVTYWCGPAVTDRVATQMSDGGWNLVWCTEAELDVAMRHGLRAQLQDGLLSPASLDNPVQREKLEALISRVRQHPALYDYFITDEPSAPAFPALARLVAFLWARDPAHPAYINLFPTYASNEQLGTKGDVITAYREHLREFVETVKPALLSYDHYQFTLKGDSDQYFLNLALIRRAALDAGLPFLNIVQASTWAPESMRVPGPDEMRFLVYTTLAYGAQGISYYIYTCGNHLGGIANADGSPTQLYAPLSKLNREFVAIALQLQSLESTGVYHAGMQTRGSETVPANLPFQLDPPIPGEPHHPPAPVKGALVGCFGPKHPTRKSTSPTHAVIVNLDYEHAMTVGLREFGRLDSFDPATETWRPLARRRPKLALAPGEGALVRVR